MVNHFDNQTLDDIKSNTPLKESNDPELVEGPWFVYICKSFAGHYYVGISSDPIKRLDKHNKGTGSQMAKDQGGFILVYTSEAFQNKSIARKREIQIKKWSRAKKEKLITGIWK